MLKLRVISANQPNTGLNVALETGQSVTLPLHHLGRLLVACGVLAMGLPNPVMASEGKDKDTAIPIDMSALSATKNEIAVLQVLSEICPPMLKKSQQQGFANAYNIELKKLLPTLNNPREAIQYLSTQQDYKKILAETRQWTLSFPKSENQQICTELATYHYK